MTTKSMITPPSFSNHSRCGTHMRPNTLKHRRIKLALADNLRFYGPSELEIRLFHSLFVIAGATGCRSLFGAISGAILPTAFL